jgi:PhzF family phenazine biosynthesis protein
MAFAAPTLTRSSVAPEAITELLAALGLRAEQLRASQHLVNGPRYIALLLDHADTVLAIEPNLAELRAGMVRAGISGIGMAAVDHTAAAHGLIKRSNREARAFAGHASDSVDAAPPDQQAQVSVRFFANDVMVIEDPVTGSFNASLAQWLMADGLAPNRYIATQGTCLGRCGQVNISQDEAGQVWVGGHTVTCIDGQVLL